MWKDITDRLLTISEHCLWLPKKEWAQKQKPGVTLTFKAGRGKRTYHRGGNPDHIITIGKKCVEENFLSPLTASKWLHFREIIDRGYFDRQISPSTMLTGILCHEFAHFVQVLLGARPRGSVHNDAFYKILDRIHHNGHAEKIRNTLLTHLSNLSLKDQFLEEEFPNFKYPNINDTVEIPYLEGTLFGKIRAINGSNVTIEGYFCGQRTRTTKSIGEILEYVKPKNRSDFI